MHSSNKTRQNDYIKKFKDKIMKLNFKERFNIYKNREKELLKNVIVVIPARGGSKRILKKKYCQDLGKANDLLVNTSCKKIKICKFYICDLG